MALDFLCPNITRHFLSLLSLTACLGLFSNQSHLLPTPRLNDSTRVLACPLTQRLSSTRLSWVTALNNYRCINYSDYCSNLSDGRCFEWGRKLNFRATQYTDAHCKIGKSLGWLPLPLCSPQRSRPSPGATLRAPHMKAKTLCWGAHLMQEANPWNTAGRRLLAAKCCPPPQCWVMQLFTRSNRLKVLHITVCV